VTPGPDLTVDECMSQWTGHESVMKHAGVPHVTKIPRKPQPCGFELKSLCDSSSTIMLVLELQKGLIAQARGPPLPFSNLPHHCAIPVRLSQNYHHSWRSVTGDGGFGSVKTAHELYKHGLFFLGCVKTASKGFPKKLFQHWAARDDHDRGAHWTATATINDPNCQYGDTKLTALAWVPKGGMVKHFIGTRSTTRNGAPHAAARTKCVEKDGLWVKERTWRVTPRPELVHDIFHWFGMIDFHDRIRQGELALESHHHTNVWWKRLHTTIYGMCVVDSFKMYRLEYMRINNGSHDGAMTFREFAGVLAFELVHWPEDGASTMTRSAARQMETEQNGCSIQKVGRLCFRLCCWRAR
jgi:hypothetical protein